VERASAGAPGRILAGIVLFAAAAALYGVSASDAFAVEPSAVEIRGARWTSEAALKGVLGLAESRPNLFRLRTGELVERLRTLPAVAGADVRAVLPDRLVVEVRERAPIAVWAAGERRLLVDVDGVLFAEARGEVGTELPVVLDGREASAGLRVGERLEPVDLAVARTVGAVTPLDVGSSATALRVTIDPELGWLLESEPPSWRAVFGLYTPTLRTAEIVPRQVQCLRELLAGREREVATIYLSPGGDRCGTFVAREP
jgi:cell division septal protein FtsQ